MRAMKIQQTKIQISTYQFLECKLITHQTRYKEHQTRYQEHQTRYQELN